MVAARPDLASSPAGVAGQVAQQIAAQQASQTTSDPVAGISGDSGGGTVDVYA